MSASALSVRAATAQDLPRVASLASRALGEGAWTLESLEQELRLAWSSLLLLEDVDGALLGFAHTWTVAGEMELLQLCVDPMTRRRGYGRALLAEVRLAGVRGGAGLLHLEVRAGNEPALRLYLAEGFVEVGRRKGYYQDGEDALLLTLGL